MAFTPILNISNLRTLSLSFSLSTSFCHQPAKKGTGKSPPHPHGKCFQNLFLFLLPQITHSFPLLVLSSQAWPPGFSLVLPLPPTLLSQKLVDPRKIYAKSEVVCLSTWWKVCPLLHHPNSPLPYPTSPVNPATECFCCHHLSHYLENCFYYWCPHCKELVLGYPACLCLHFQWSFCKQWCHFHQACLQWVCGHCNQPGHVTDNCPFMVQSLE